MLSGAVSVRATAWLVFLSLAFCYLALAPATTAGRGYTYEDMQAGLGLLTSFNAWVKGRPVPPIAWTRHGPVPLLLDLPFLKLGKFFVSPDFVLSLQAVLLTAALMTIVYVWLRQLCTPGMSLLLTLSGAFATLLWPYAYIGLETKQSFFVVLAGYLGLARGRLSRWPHIILLAVVSALAISVKSTGVVLAPAIAWVLYAQFRDDWPSRRKQALGALGIVGGIWILSVIGWNAFWGPRGGGPQVLVTQWTIDSPFQLFTNVIGILGSPTKGLFVFAPPLLLAVYAIPRAYRTQKQLVVFALLISICTIAFISILFVTADELWGPRFMHVLVAPVLVVIGAANPRFQWRRHVPVIVLAAIGCAISFLGAFYYYGVRAWAANNTGQNTLEWFYGDPVWSEIQFDARLLRVWWKGGTNPVMWTPKHYWAWTPPADAQPWKSINLRDYADPQSFLLYYWKMPLEGANLVIFRICLGALIVGPLLLLWVVALTVRISVGAVYDRAFFVDSSKKRAVIDRAYRNRDQSAR